MDLRSIERERRTITLKSRRKVDVSWDDAAIEERVHAVSNVVLGDRRRVSEWVIAEVLWQDSLCFEHFVLASLADSNFLKLDVCDCALTATIIELVGRQDAKLFPYQIVAV